MCSSDLGIEGAPGALETGTVRVSRLRCHRLGPPSSRVGGVMPVAMRLATPRLWAGARDSPRMNLGSGSTSVGRGAPLGGASRGFESHLPDHSPVSYRPPPRAARGAPGQRPSAPSPCREPSATTGPRARRRCRSQTGSSPDRRDRTPPPSLGLMKNTTALHRTRIDDLLRSAGCTDVRVEGETLVAHREGSNGRVYPLSVDL